MSDKTLIDIAILSAIKHVNMRRVHTRNYRFWKSHNEIFDSSQLVSYLFLAESPVFMNHRDNLGRRRAVNEVCDVEDKILRHALRYMLSCRALQRCQFM